MDSKGLITADRKGLQDHKICGPLWVFGDGCRSYTIIDFARKDYNGPPLTNLSDIVDYVKPTALLGLSTIRVCAASQRLVCVCGSSLITEPERVFGEGGQTDGGAEPASHHFPIVKSRILVRS